jgi:serine/threonine-protein kinase
MALEAGQRIGPYVVEEALPTGRGGFAQVVLARNPRGRGELVAVKVQHVGPGHGQGDSTAFEAALSNEVEMLRRVRHPGIVRIVPIPLDPERPIYLARDLHLPGQPWYFAMEYLAGGTLDELVRRTGALDPALAGEIAAQVGDALAYLHREGMAHLDIKPRNIMFRQPLQPGQAPQVVVGDLGMAQHQALSAEIEGGSLEYLPPERLPLLDGQLVPDSPEARAAADIYSLGVTLCYALTGQMPFRGTAAQLRRAIVQEQPGQPAAQGKLHAREGYASLYSLALAMLNKSPELRPNAEAVLRQIDRAVPPPRMWLPRALQPASRPAQEVRQRREPERAKPTLVTPVPGAKPPARPRWAITLAVAVLFVAGMLGGWAVRAGAPERAWQAVRAAFARPTAMAVKPPTRLPTPAPVVIGGDLATAKPTTTPAPTSTASALLTLVSPALDATVNADTITLDWDYRALRANEVFQVRYYLEGRESEAVVIEARDSHLALAVGPEQRGQLYWRVSVRSVDIDAHWSTVAESYQWHFWVEAPDIVQRATPGFTLTVTLALATATLAEPTATRATPPTAGPAAPNTPAPPSSTSVANTPVPTQTSAPATPKPPTKTAAPPTATTIMVYQQTATAIQWTTVPTTPPPTSTAVPAPTNTPWPTEAFVPMPSNTPKPPTSAPTKIPS